MEEQDSERGKKIKIDNMLPQFPNDVSIAGPVGLHLLFLYLNLSPGSVLPLPDTTTTNMPMILNIHTPSDSFALPYRQGESADALIDRIARKAGVPKGDAVQALKDGRGGAGLRYEFDGGRWTLADGA